jgi:hypothetical protein
MLEVTTSGQGSDLHTMIFFGVSVPAFRFSGKEVGRRTACSLRPPWRSDVEQEPEMLKVPRELYSILSCVQVFLTEPRSQDRDRLKHAGGFGKV